MIIEWYLLITSFLGGIISIYYSYIDNTAIYELLPIGLIYGPYIITGFAVRWILEPIMIRMY